MKITEIAYGNTIVCNTNTVLDDSTNTVNYTCVITVVIFETTEIVFST